VNQKQAKPKKVVKIANETISIKESITLSEIFIKFRNRRIKSLFGLLILTAVIASISAIVGYYFPLWAGIVIGVVLSIGACYWVDRKMLIEVHKIRNV
jgi:hypothetical protein